MKMEKYNYYDHVEADIMSKLEEMLYNGDINKESLISEDWENLVFADVEESLWVCDGVTGNASGSYTFSTWKAEENLCHNLDLLAEAYENFGANPDLSSAEACDVTIRCYLLGQLLYGCLEAIREVLINA